MESLNWRKASYSAANGGGCVEVADRSNRVLVRDTQDRTGPVLTFSPDAWRRFAEQVKRSLAPEPYRGSRTSCKGTLGVRGCSPVLVASSSRKTRARYTRIAARTFHGHQLRHT
jgi:hypothetical protein